MIFGGHRCAPFPLAQNFLFATPGSILYTQAAWDRVVDRKKNKFIV